METQTQLSNLNCVAEVRWAEAAREQLADPVALDRRAVTAGADDLYVSAGEAGGFEDRLATSAAWRADHRTLASGNRDPRDLVEAEFMLRGSQRALLRAEAETVAGVLHVRACDHFPVHALDRAADVKSRVRRVSLERRLTGEGDQLFICHRMRLGGGTSNCHPELVSGSIPPSAPPIPTMDAEASSAWRKWWQAEARREVEPLRILAFDQIDLPLPMPALQLLLPLDRLVHRAVQFKPHEPVHGIFRGEAWNAIATVLEEPGNQVRRNTDVQGAVLTAGEDIDARLLHRGRACGGMDAETSSA